MLGGAAAVAAVSALVVLLALVAVAILPARTDREDTSGRKVYAKFLLVSAFVFLFAGLFSAYGVATSLTGLMGHASSAGPSCVSSGGMSFGSSIGPSGSASSSPSSGPILCPQINVSLPLPFAGTGGTPGDRAARGAVVYGLLLIVSATIVWMQGHAAGRLFASDETKRGSPGRVLDAYLFSAAFVSLVVFILAVVGALYGLFALIGPGTFGAAGRGVAGRQLISGGVLAILADGVLFWHVRHAWRVHAAPTATEPMQASPAAPEGPGSEPPASPLTS